MIDVEITINEVEIAAFEHQLTNYSNPVTHSLKFKFKNLKKVLDNILNFNLRNSHLFNKMSMKAKSWNDNSVI